MVADRAAEIDLDLFDVDLEGLGPVAAFEIKQTAGQCCNDYRVYALEKPVHLLRELRGGHFTGADTDLDGRVEIWAEDRGAINGLDDLSQMEIQHPPTYVLRFEQGRLLDATAAFRDDFDKTIAKLRAGMAPGHLKAFRQSDGVLRFSAQDLDRWRELRTTKIQVLEIVWAYLYSGREHEAWEALHAMWPESDEPRIQRLLVNARSRGIAGQIDGVSSPPVKNKHAQIFDDPQPSRSLSTLQPGAPRETPPAGSSGQRLTSRAQSIYTWQLPPSDPKGKGSTGEAQLLDLVIDSAGKVRSVKWADLKTPPDDALTAYAFEWKFIPALRRGRSVASRLRLALSLKR